MSVTYSQSMSVVFLAILVWMLFDALRRSKIGFVNSIIDKSSSPLVYWGIVLVYLGMIIYCVLGALGLDPRMFVPES